MGALHAPDEDDLADRKTVPFEVLVRQAGARGTAIVEDHAQLGQSVAGLGDVLDPGLASRIGSLAGTLEPDVLNRESPQSQ